MLFEENKQSDASNTTATDTEGLIGTAGATVFLQPLLDALAVFGGINYDSANEAMVLPEPLAYYDTSNETIVFGRH